MDDKLLKKQLFYTRLTAIFMGIVMVTVLSAGMIILPGAVSTLRKADSLIGDVRETVANADATLADVDEMALAVTQAAGELNSVDFESLNDAIVALKDTVEPLADMMGGLSAWDLR